MGQSFNEFKNSIRSSTKGKKFKITGSWGTYSAYKYMRKNGWYNIGRPILEHEFYAIIRRVNDLLAENLSNGITVNIPGRMGCLEVRKTERGVSFVDGKLKNTYPIDWNKTLHLWYEDKEARDKKILVRDEQKYVFKVKYNKHRAVYDNKQFYQFTLNDKIKTALKANIVNRKIDSLW